ncbi:YceD family protein [Hydrogenophaga sp. 5NK40-0174]|uniref:YceD family protein n=1 Tax=Hydrogenophaga sp. 5NK40-0174 TaxID=3127649 RepID=UPI0033409DF8
MSSTESESARRWNLRRLDVQAFARAAVVLDGESPLSDFERLVEDTVAVLESQTVKWSLRGEVRKDASSGEASVWLLLAAETCVALKCQRCLEPVAHPLGFEQWFRFVATEDQAAMEDEDAEEDVLAWDPRPNLFELMEDELLMAMPMVPMHDTCPVPVKSQAGEEELEDKVVAATEKPHPFASLASLKKPH